MYELFDFQQRSSDEIVRRFKFMLNHTKSAIKRPTIMLEAPTGSGKTVMVADAMERILSGEYDPALLPEGFFLVITPGKGGLDIQTHAALTRYMGNRKVWHLTEDTNLDAIGAGDVAVVNYEKLWLTHKDTAANQEKGIAGLPKSRIVRSAEFPNFEDMLTRFKNEGVQVSVFSDEDHYGKGGTTPALGAMYEMFRDALGYNPVRIAASATPVKDVSGNYFKLVSVGRDEVVDAGLIRKNVILDPGLADAMSRLRSNMDNHGNAWVPVGKEHWLEDDNLIYAQLTWEKHVELKKSIAQNSTVPYLPVLLVCLPNINYNGEYVYDTMVDFFKHKLGEGNFSNKVKSYLSEDKDKDPSTVLADFGSEVEVVMFKVSLALGWDVPRAQTMLMTRKVAESNKSFTTQLLGRILRQPHRQAYDNELLDNAYLFAPVHESFVIPAGINDMMVDHRHDKFRDPKVATTTLIKNLNILVQGRSRPSQNGKDDYKFDAAVAYEVLNGIDYVGNDIAINIGKYASDQTLDMSGDMDVIANAHFGKSNLAAWYDVLDMIREQLIHNGVARVERFTEGVRDGLRIHLSDARNVSANKQGWWLDSNHEFVKLAVDMMTPLMKKALDTADDWGRQKTATLELGRREWADADAKADAGVNHSYGKKVPQKHVHSTLTEKRFFDDFLKEDTCVVTWHRNDTSLAGTTALGRSFAVPYQYDGVWNVARPDYVTVLKDRSGQYHPVIFEVKDLHAAGSGDFERNAAKLHYFIQHNTRGLQEPDEYVKADSRHGIAQKVPGKYTSVGNTKIFMVSYNADHGGWMVATGKLPGSEGKFVYEPLSDVLEGLGIETALRLNTFIAV